MGVATGFLAKVELGQRDAEHGHAAQGIQQRTVGNGIQPHVAQRAVAGQQRRVNLVAGFNDRPAVVVAAIQLRFRPVAGGFHFSQQPLKQLPVGFRHIAHFGFEGAVGFPHGELSLELL